MQYSEEILESCAKQAEFRVIIFALCYFHAALLERKKFGVGNMPGMLYFLCTSTSMRILPCIFYLTIMPNLMEISYFLCNGARLIKNRSSVC